MLLQQPQIPVPLQIHFPFPAWATRVERGRRRARARTRSRGSTDEAPPHRRLARRHARCTAASGSTSARAVLDEVVEIARRRTGRRRARVRRHLRALRAVGRGRADRLRHAARTSAPPAPKWSSIPGNHDYAKRLGAVEALFAAAGVHVVPEVRRPERRAASSSCTARDGTTRAEIACLPWVRRAAAVQRGGHDARAGGAVQGVRGGAPAADRPPLRAARPDRRDRPRRPRVRLRRAARRRRARADDRPALRRQPRRRCRRPCSTSRSATSTVRRTCPAAATPARYAGSLLQLDFGESEQHKSVTIVEVEPGRPPRTREVALTQGPPARRAARHAGRARRPTSDADDAWLKVELVCDGPQPGLADQVREILPNALEVRLDYPRQDAERRAGELRRLTPRDLFARYYHERHGAPIDDAVMQALRRAAGGGRRCARLGSRSQGFTAFHDAPEGRLHEARPVRDHRADRRRQDEPARRDGARALRRRAADRHPGTERARQPRRRPRRACCSSSASAGTPTASPAGCRARARSRRSSSASSPSAGSTCPRRAA